MGLIKEGDDYIVLTDIAGVEDHLGDMDFKVAGSEDGITALQMDIKITGVTFEILTDALEQARKGRLFILGKMAEAIDAPREKLSEYAPAIESIKIDPEKIGAVIGKGGETIRGMQEEFEAEIDIDDDGTVRVYAPSGALVEACIARIESMTREAEVGDHFPNGQGRQDDHVRRLRRARQGHRRPAAHLEREARRAGRHGRERALARATRSTSPWPRSTRSAAGSACASPTTRRSPARRPEELQKLGTGDPTMGGGGGGRGGRDGGGARWPRRSRRRERRRDGGGGRGGRQRRAPRLTWPICPRASSSPTLDSGLRVVTEAVPSVRSVALGLWVRTGSRDETPAQAGVSHFLEHLLFKGTERHSAIEISELFDGMGAATNAATGKETTHLHARFLDEHTEEAFDLMAEMLLAPVAARRTRSTPSARSCSRRSRCTRTSPRTASTTCSPRRSTATTRSAAGCSGAPR